MNADIDISRVTLRTERLILRPWRISDLDDFYAYASVDGVGQMAGWKPHESREESLSILKRFIEQGKTFALELDGRVVGSLGIERYDEDQFPELADKRCREIGYVLAKDCWGRGLMPEAVSEVLRYLFEDLGLDAALCGHFLSNRQSLRVQEKCGFRHYAYGRFETASGTSEDDETRMITREEWTALRRGAESRPDAESESQPVPDEGSAPQPVPAAGLAAAAPEPAVEYAEVPAPMRDHGEPLILSDEAMKLRMEKVLARMRARGLDRFAVYCDAEHGYNFAYLTGFYTRFEEALMLLDAEGCMTLVLGNENLNKASSARFPCRAVLAPQFSLPDQPDSVGEPLEVILGRAGLAPGQRVGLAGWKLLREPSAGQGAGGAAKPSIGDAAEPSGHRAAAGLFDVPSFIVDAIKSAVGASPDGGAKAAGGPAGELVNATDIFIGEDGARTASCADEVAHYEYGAALAWDSVLDAMDALEPGVSELELGELLQREGQHTVITTIAAAGKRFEKGNMFPTGRRAAVGAPVSLTVGYAGGSSSRAGYAVRDASELPPGAERWLDELAKPYFRAYARWMETARVGMTGGELFAEIERVLPRAVYGWSLCPGHLASDEEWLCSPVYEGSSEILKSGMIFQIDIIPGRPGMSGVSCESTVLLADAELRDEIRLKHPQLWERMISRAAYIRRELGIRPGEDLLPMCGGAGYMRPFMLDKGRALRLSR